MGQVLQLRSSTPCQVLTGGASAMEELEESQLLLGGLDPSWLPPTLEVEALLRGVWEEMLRQTRAAVVAVLTLLPTLEAMVDLE